MTNPSNSSSTGIGAFFALLAGSAGVRAAGAALGIVATFVATAQLGPDGAGVVYGTIAWVMGVSILTRWGGVERLLLEIPKSSRERRRVAIPALVNRELAAGAARSLVFLTVLLAGWFILQAFTRPPPLSFSLLALYLPLHTVLQLMSAALKGLGRAATAIALEFAVPPAFVLLMALVAAADRASTSVAMIGGAYVAGSAVAIVVCSLVLAGHRWHFRRSARASAATARGRRNFALIELIGFFNGWITLILLPLLTTAADVGRFNLVLRMSGAILLIASTLFAVIVPRLSAARENHDMDEWRRIISLTRLSMAAMGFAFIVAVLLMGQHLLAVVGEEFVSAALPLYLLGTCYGLGVALGPSDAVLLAAGHERTVRNLTLFATIAMLVALPPAALSYGLTGIALAAGIGYLLVRGSLFVAELILREPDAGPAG